jgi:nucleoside-diphosphate kinase
MALERTLSIIKPDAVEKNCIGAIIHMFESAGLRVIASRMMQLSRKEAETFYAIHTGKPFFESLIAFITSGPCLAMVLEGENAILKNREIMGATNPKKAAPGTIRELFCKDIGDRLERNAVHGSDSAQTAIDEISYFFGKKELFSR